MNKTLQNTYNVWCKVLRGNLDGAKEIQLWGEVLYKMYSCEQSHTIKISAAQNFTPDIVSILHSLIHKALVKYKIGQEDYIEN